MGVHRVMVVGGLSNKIDYVDSHLLFEFTLNKRVRARFYLDLDTQEKSSFPQEVGQLTELFLVFFRNHRERLFDEGVRLNLVEFVRNSFDSLG